MRNTSYQRKSPPMILRKIGMIIGGVILAVFLAFIFGYFVMLLWNWIMPAIFGLPGIDYWMAFGIIILARLIFGGLGNGHRDSKKDSHHKRYYSSKFAQKFRGRDCKPHKWSMYEDYWEEEGEQAFKDYVERKKSGEQDSGSIETPVE